MEFPRQPGPVKVVITSDHPEDIYRATLIIRAKLENHYASIHSVSDDSKCVIDCYPFAVND